MADVVDTQTAALPPTRVPVLAGAASHGSPADLRPSARQNSPATRAMRLTKTAPQPALPDEAEQATWGNGYHGPDDPQAGDAGAGGTASAQDHSDGRHGYDDDEDDYAQHREGRRRWPIVTTLLVLLVLLIGGGLYGGWRYVQGQYYVGVQDGNVAIFRGINQNLAGISLSSLITRTGLPISQVVASNQSMIRQTIPASSLADAQTLVGQIQSEVDNCKQKWQALVQWQAAETRYQAEVAAYRAKKAKVPPKDNPGGQPPTPDAAGCAPASAFGIPATALPGGQPTPAPSAPATPTRPAATPTARTSARATTRAAA